MSPTTPYPVGYESDFAEGRSRLSVFFRYFIAIPHFIVAMFYGIALYVTVVIAWFAIVFTGRYPEGLYGFNANVVRWMTRLQAYVQLATDAYPPFDLGEHPEYPIRVPIAPPLASYSRLKTGLRAIIGIPVMLINYALGVVAGVAAFISWFWIVISGRQNEGLHGAITLGTAYYARSTAYLCLLTETWPPFSPEGGSSLGPAPQDAPPPVPQEAPPTPVGT